MSLYLGKTGRIIVKFTLAHPKINKGVSLVGGTLHAITGGKYQVGRTRAAYNMASQLASYKEGFLSANGGNLMYSPSLNGVQVPINFNGNPIRVKDMPPVPLTDKLKTPEGASKFLKKIYISPTSRIEQYGITLYGSYDCFTLWTLRSLKGLNEMYFGNLGDGEMNTYYGFINKLSRSLSRYPAVIASHFPSNIGLTHSNGLSSPLWFKGIFVNGTEDTINHELQHWLEYSHNTGEMKNLVLAQVKAKKENKNIPDFSLNKIWLKVFPYREDAPRDNDGFVYFYGKRSPFEDRATIAGMLYSYDKQTLQVRLAADDVLKRKVELLTGCKYDTASGIFTKVISKQELMKDFGIEEHHFYAKWSEVDGKISMDAEYWNNIIRNNTEVTAKTIINSESESRTWAYHGWINALKP